MAGLYSSQASRLTELHGADLVTILKNDILHAKTILDVGCGTGAFAKAYLQQFPKGVPGQTLILSDLSEGMLQKAKDTVKPGSDCQTKIVFQVEDGTKLAGVADDSIDIVVSLFGVFLIPDQDAAMKAIARVLKPGNGVFANGSWMFGQSDYFSSQGFGVSLQDAFKLPNDIIDPSKNDDLAYLKWGTADDCRVLLGNHVPDNNSIQCYNVIHNTVWQFDDLWTMMVQNPMSALQGASDNDFSKARDALHDFVTDNGKLSLQDPLMLSTASILAVAKGFGNAPLE